jgi:hypothetical protein
MFKSLFLQEDEETIKLFDYYFDDVIDQLELASRLSRKKVEIGFS